MPARLERYIDGRTARGGTGPLQRDRFSMRRTCVMVVSFADDLPIANDDGADRRIRRRASDRAGCQLVRALQIEGVERR